MAQESSILIEVSDDGTTWTTLTTKAAGATSHSHTGLTAGTTKQYRIKAVGDGTTTSDSAYATASATTTGGTGTALAAPTVTAAPSNSVEQAMRLNWNNVANNSGYRIEYSTDNSTWQTAGTVAAGVITFLHEGLSANTLYYYRVITLGTGSYTNSVPSAVVSAKTYRHINLFNDLSALTINNPNPTVVTFGIDAGRFKMENTGTGTTANSVANNAIYNEGFALPATFEFRVLLGASGGNAPIQRIGVITDTNDFFFLARGNAPGTNSDYNVEVVAGSVTRSSTTTTGISPNWMNVERIKFVFTSATSYAAYVATATGAWVQVGPTFTDAFTGTPKVRFSLAHGADIKTVFVDTLMVY